MNLENRRYELRASERWLGFILAPLLGFGWAVLCIAIFFVHASDTADIVQGIGFLALPCGLLAWGFLYSLRTSVTFTQGEIVVQRAFRERRAKRSQVAAFRRVVEGLTNSIHLFEADSTSPLIELPPQIVFDPDFDAWLAGLVDLDARDSQRSMDRYLEESSQPGSSEEKLAALKSARGIATTAKWAALVLFAAIVFMGSRLDFLIAVAVLPWIAVALAVVRPTLFVLEEDKSEVRASLFGACLVPSLALVYAAISGGLSVYAGRLALIVAASMIVSSAVVLWLVASLRRQPRALWSTLALTALYSVGLVCVVNRDFDRGPMVVHETRVEERISEGSRNYILRVAQWGPRPNAEDFGVKRDFFDRVEKGQTVCVQLWPGALGVRWYELKVCPAG
ncbi:MAG: hypothetical protein H7Y89_03280 [Steroidobacteraceae bacterium]|nr:hypothetical protein [Steroidobacteraceae bacterium]